MAVGPCSASQTQVRRTRRWPQGLRGRVSGCRAPGLDAPRPRRVAMRGSAEGRGCEVQGAEEATPCWAMASGIGPVPPCASAGDPSLLAPHSQTLAPRAAGVARSAALACGGGGRCGGPRRATGPEDWRRKRTRKSRR